MILLYISFLVFLGIGAYIVDTHREEGVIIIFLAGAIMGITLDNTITRYECSSVVRGRFPGYKVSTMKQPDMVGSGKYVVYNSTEAKVVETCIGVKP